MKKSFILHIDSLEVLDEMTYEQKGILFNAIYKYQIGENVELDFAMKMAFAPFKNQFIRDNEAYLEISEAKSFKGKIGNLKRWHPDLYAQLNEDKTNIDELMEVAKSRSSDVSNPQQSSTIPQSLDSKKGSNNDSKSDSKKDLKHPSGVSGLENSVHHQIIKIHSDFYAQKNDGLKYRFQAAADGKAVKDIVEYLRTAKAPPKSPNEIIFAWEWILSNYDKWDSFHQKRLKLTQINSELPNIISIIKNGKSNSKNRTNGQSPDDAVAQSVRVAEMLRGDNDKRH
jgi:hypothetical protein